MGGAFILDLGHEKHEAIIEVIMKRLGVQKSVIIVRDLVGQFAYASIWSTTCVIIMWAAFYKESLGFGVFLLFAWLH